MAAINFSKLLRQRWLYHAMFWIVFVVPFIILMGGKPDFSYFQSFVSVSLEAMVYALIVYVNLLVLIPNYLQRRKYGTYFLLLLGCTVLTVPLHSLVDYTGFYRGQGLDESINYWRLLLLSFINITVMLVLTTALKFGKEWFQHQQEKQQLEKEKLQAELQFLKSQINPHFLFNTLNNLYSLTLKKSDSAPELVLKLSEIMRYMLYNSNDKMVPLEMEVNYLKNYIDLEKIRQVEKTRIKVELEGHINGQMIAPLLFIPFLENSFKHGVNNNIDPGWVDVKLEIESDEVLFTVANNKPRKPRPDTGSGGIGLKNVKRRLDLLYPDKHELIIEDMPEYYRTQLKISLQ